jgi:hypothetical protein
MALLGLSNGYKARPWAFKSQTNANKKDEINPSFLFTLDAINHFARHRRDFAVCFLWQVCQKQTGFALGSLVPNAIRRSHRYHYTNKTE